MCVVKILNSEIKSLLFLEFLTNSFQLAASLLNAMQMSFSFVLFFNFAFLTQRVVEIMLLHGSADAIKSESLKLSDAIYESKWNEFDKKCTDLLRLMLRVSQRPLLITIGSFGEMSLQPAIKIFKGAYSIVTFFQHGRNK
ncbi:odorant receptor Or2-like [Aethina tumida]|uniref:odorant receptor Or2-like n=1 Tax=Aethina tumida TaxID=116153 RepID=UPI002147AA00|nr:odorant receptor Or2-like [Aethina tumida]